MVPSIWVGRVRISVTFTVTVRVSRVSVMVSVRDSVRLNKHHCEYGTLNSMFAG